MGRIQIFRQSHLYNYNNILKIHLSFHNIFIRFATHISEFWYGLSVLNSRENAETSCFIQSDHRI